VYRTALGGDQLPAWRLLAPIPPLLAVASVAAYGVLTAPTARAHRRETRLIPVVAFALAGLSLLVTVLSPNMLDGVRALGTRTAQLGEIGSWLAESLPPGTVMSTYDNGALSYRAGTQLQVVDVLGVTDEQIARHGVRAENPGPTGGIASDYDYVITLRRPAVAVTTSEGYAPSQHCAIDPVYAGRYQVATFRREDSRAWIALYLRSEQAATLIAELDRDSRFVYVSCPA